MIEWMKPQGTSRMLRRNACIHGGIPNRLSHSHFSPLSPPQSNPEVLRQALSVVRLHGDFQRRKLEAAKSKLQGCVRGLRATGWTVVIVVLRMAPFCVCVDCGQ